MEREEVVDRRIDDRGFGLVEIIISMLLLATLLAALAPLLANSILTTAKMTTIATATQFTSEGLEAARAQASVFSCSGWTAPTPTTLERSDSRGVALERTISFSPCTDHLVSVSVSVVAKDQTAFFSAGQELATAATKVYLE